jgi:hypothetical protein
MQYAIFRATDRNEYPCVKFAISSSWSLISVPCRDGFRTSYLTPFVSALGYCCSMEYSQKSIMVHHDLVASVFLPLNSPSSTAVFCHCSETPPPSRRWTRLRYSVTRRKLRRAEMSKYSTLMRLRHGLRGDHTFGPDPSASCLIMQS